MSNENIKEDWRDFREDYRNNRIPKGVLLIFKTNDKKFIGFFKDNSAYFVEAGNISSVPYLDGMVINEYKVIDMKKIGE